MYRKMAEDKGRDPIKSVGRPYSKKWIKDDAVFRYNIETKKEEFIYLGQIDSVFPGGKAVIVAAYPNDYLLLDLADRITKKTKYSAETMVTDDIFLFIGRPIKWVRSGSWFVGKIPEYSVRVGSFQARETELMIKAGGDYDETWVFGLVDEDVENKMLDGVNAEENPEPESVAADQE